MNKNLNGQTVALRIESGLLMARYGRKEYVGIVSTTDASTYVLCNSRLNGAGNLGMVTWDGATLESVAAVTR